MNNEEFWTVVDYFKSNNKGEELRSDQIVKHGLGQTIGGYFDEAQHPHWHNEQNKKIWETETYYDTQSAKPSQYFHFYEYYVENRLQSGKDKKLPTYPWLKCPQLLMYIAEVAGLDSKRLDDAYEFLEKVEKERNLKGTEKSAKYLKSEELKDYKKLLCISTINKIIKEIEKGEKQGEELREEIRNAIRMKL